MPSMFTNKDKLHFLFHEQLKKKWLSSAPVNIFDIFVSEAKGSSCYSCYTLKDVISCCSLHIIASINVKSVGTYRYKAS